MSRSGRAAVTGENVVLRRNRLNHAAVTLGVDQQATSAGNTPWNVERNTRIMSHERRPLLGDGYLQVTETWGSDERIIEAARMSTGKGFLGWGPKVCPVCATLSTEDADWVDRACQRCAGTGQVEGDEKLLRYLYTHQHHTPFEMAGATIEVQAPLMVFREWHRHRTQSYNELSARYTVLPDLFYIPSADRIRQGRQSTTNKQGSSLLADNTFSETEVARISARFAEASAEARKTYDWMVASGVSRELARLIIPVNQFSRMRASANLRNWLSFIRLRADTSAQWEIRQYAQTLDEELTRLFPRTMELFHGDHVG